MLDLNPQFSNNNPNRIHNFNHHYGFNDGVQFRVAETREEEDDQEVSSPPLWRTNNNPDGPVRFTNPRALSPASRAQAIARGQRELMEMVETMPETSYELSLKDMVEKRREFVDETHSSMEESGEEERSILRGGGSQRWQKSKKGSVKRQESSGSNRTGRVIVKNGSMNHNKGLLINMFFPFSFGTKRKSSSTVTSSTSFGNNNNSVKFSLKPELLLMEKSPAGDHRRDWWWWKKHKAGSAGDSESLEITSSSAGESTGRSGSTGSSGSSGGGSLRSNSDRKINGCKYGCWSFFPSRKKKS